MGIVYSVVRLVGVYNDTSGSRLLLLRRRDSGKDSDTGTIYIPAITSLDKWVKSIYAPPGHWARRDTDRTGTCQSDLRRRSPVWGGHRAAVRLFR